MRHLYFVSILCLLSACESIPSWMGGSEKDIKRLPGERQDVLQSSGDFKVDEILAQVSFQVPPATENANWAQATGAFTAENGNLKLAGDFSASQSATAGDGNAFSHTQVPRPVVAHGKVFAMDAAGYISAHDVQNISQKFWVSPTFTHNNGDEVMGGGLAVDGGKLYAVSGLGRVGVLDVATGAELWKRELGIPLRSAPRVADGKLFVISIDSQLFALDAATGSTLWSHRGIGEAAGLMNNVSPAIAGDSVIVPYGSGELYALKKENGDEDWRASLAQARRTEATAIFSGIGGNPVVDEVVVFAVSSSGLFSAFNVLNGQPLWEKKIASINTPWLAGEYVFVLTEDNQLVAMVKYDGRVRWVAPLPRYKDDVHKIYPIVWRGPVMVDGKLVLVNADGEMKIIDAANGAELATFAVAKNISTAPIVAAGKMFLVDKDATLYSYQ